MPVGHKPRKTSPQAYKAYRSTVAGKKWDVYIPRGGRLRKVSYGAAGMSDYTKHKDRARRDSYRARHANDRLDDPYSAGFWAMWHLWGRSSDHKRAFAQAVARAKRLVDS